MDLSPNFYKGCEVRAVKADMTSSGQSLREKFNKELTEIGNSIQVLVSLLFINILYFN